MPSKATLRWLINLCFLRDRRRFSRGGELLQSASELLLDGGRFCDNRYRTRDDNLLITAARLRTFADWKNALSSEDSQNVMPVVI